MKKLETSSKTSSDSSPSREFLFTFQVDRRRRLKTKSFIHNIRRAPNNKATDFYVVYFYYIFAHKRNCFRAHGKNTSIQFLAAGSKKSCLLLTKLKNYWATFSFCCKNLKRVAESGRTFFVYLVARARGQLIIY